MAIESLDERMFKLSFQKMHRILDAGDFEVLPPIQNDLLFKACAYVGTLVGFVAAHPKSQAVLNPDEIDNWMNILAEHSKTAYRSFELKDDWWHSLADPLIVFEGDKWIPRVILPKREATATMLDVETGTRTPMNAALASKIQSTAYMFYDILPDESNGVKDLFRLGLRSIKGQTLSIFGIALLLAVVRLFTPISNEMVFDYVIPTSNTSLFFQLAAALILIQLTEYALGIVRSFSMLRFRGIIENKMQAALWERLMRLPISTFRKFPRGDLIQRMMLIDRIRPFMMGDVLYTVLEAPFSILYVFLMLYYSISLGVVMTGMLIVFYIIAFILRRQILPMITTALEKTAAVNSFLMQIATVMAKIRVGGAEKRAFSRWAHLFADLQRLNMKIGIKEIYFNLIKTLFPVISLALIYGLTAYFLKNQGAVTFNLSMGQFVAFQTSFMILSKIVGDLLTLTDSYMQIQQICHRTDALLKQPTEQIGLHHFTEKLSGNIRAENLFFQYPGAAQPTLSDISFTCEPGDFIGIVGRSGSGKSTVLRLLTALDIPESGKIFFDGRALENYDYTTLRRRMGIVLQTSGVVAGLVKDNLLMGRLTSKESFERALHLSTFDQVLKKLPMGLDTVLTGGTLSGGEEQRLLLARALMTDIDILLLDEATSALDSMTQNTIMNNLLDMKITIIAVAHRLETVRLAKEILVVKDGHIVERGDMAKLGDSSIVFNALRS